MFMKKEKPAITANKLLSGYPASDSSERKSLDGLNIRTIQKSILGSAQRLTDPELATTCSEQLQFDDSGIYKESDIANLSPFKKATIPTSGASSPSIISSAYSITDEVSEINEEIILDYNNVNSSEKTTSAEIPSSSSSRNRDSSRRLTNTSAKIKSIDFEMGNSTSNNNSSNDKSSKVNTSLSVKQLIQAKQCISRAVIQENEYESTNTSEIDSATLSSSTTTSENNKSYNYETKKHERKKKYLDENQKHRKNINIGSNKLNSESNEKYQSRSSCSADSQSYGESNFLDKRSYKTKSKSLITDMNGFTNIKCHIDDFEKSEQSDISWDPMLKHTNLLADCPRKTEHNGSRCLNSVAVQTVHLEPDNDLLPVFTPFLLKDIEKNMKGMSEKEAISTIIQTHVELIKRQARREKRILEEWDSAISDLEERCQLVSFERLKLLLHGSDYYCAS
ncbi:hypothetical protein ACH3XW_21275 [Acanthocheilonema viteae]|uniref:Uncharacterized protein n=1 Tax=Acanthocheilonema viteae TaxID=6277 RepID=A0A498S217_ACAVI|nr:unnamed protein product [Acanthocheilonema viteae]